MMDMGYLPISLSLNDYFAMDEAKEIHQAKTGFNHFRISSMGLFFRAA